MQSKAPIANPIPRPAAQEALRLNPNYGEAHGNLGMVLVRQDNLSESADPFSAVLRLNRDRDNPGTHYSP